MVMMTLRPLSLTLTRDPVSDRRLMLICPNNHKRPGFVERPGFYFALRASPLPSDAVLAVSAVILKLFKLTLLDQFDFLTMIVTQIPRQPRQPRCSGGRRRSGAVETGSPGDLRALLGRASCRLRAPAAW